MSDPEEFYDESGATGGLTRLRLASRADPSSLFDTK